MKRSSTMVPFVIIVVLVFIIVSIVILKSSYPDFKDVYDVLGITDLKLSEGDSDSALPNNEPEDFGTSEDAWGDELDFGTSDGDVSDNELNFGDLDTETTNDNNVDSGLVSGEDTPNYTPSEEFTFNKTYIRAIDGALNYDKIDFFTVSDPCDYRVHLKTKLSDKPLTGNITLTMYDERGITVATQSVQPYYGNSGYCDEFKVDFTLDPSKKHTLKISGDQLEGDYQIALLTLERDAGINEDSATPISLDEETTAVMNSTLPDWFVFTAPESGKYEITIHNINVGARLEVRGSQGASGLFSAYAGNETTKESSFFVREGEQVLIKVAPQDDEANGTYILLITKAEV